MKLSKFALLATVLMICTIFASSNKVLAQNLIKCAPVESVTYAQNPNEAVHRVLMSELSDENNNSYTSEAIRIMLQRSANQAANLRENVVVHNCRGRKPGDATELGYYVEDYSNKGVIIEMWGFVSQTTAYVNLAIYPLMTQLAIDSWPATERQIRSVVGFDTKGTRSIDLLARAIGKSPSIRMSIVLGLATHSMKTNDFIRARKHFCHLRGLLELISDDEDYKVLLIEFSEQMAEEALIRSQMPLTGVTTCL